MVSLGHVALDGTKVQANASKHKAMSYQRMLRAEKELEKEINALMPGGCQLRMRALLPNCRRS